MTAMSRDRNGVQIIRRIDMTIQLMNAGLIRRNSCGEPPIGPAPAASVVTDAATGDPMVSITWSKSSDEGAGEKDVERYSIFKKVAGGGFGEPIASIPAGSTQYTFYDRAVNGGETLVYGVTAQDCTPSVSPMNSTGSVAIPMPPT